VDIAEDVRRIGIQGFAGDQGVALYRYYRKLTTAPRQPVIYSDAEVAMLGAMRLGVLVNPSVLVGIFSRSRLRADLAADFGLSALDGSSASVLQPGAPLIVTGHSLGGHLALLFGRFFPGVTEHVYTYNAPGIGLQGELGLRLLGIAPIEPARVTNVASVMGNETISRIWSKPGENIGVATEPGSLLYQHSIVPLADTLALYGAFATLSPGLAGDPAVVSGIISAASPYAEKSLEAVLDALRAPLGAAGMPTLIARTLADLTARENYYVNLYALLDGRSSGRDYRIESLVGKSAGELAAMAGSDVSVRFALRELAPFAATNADYSAFEDSFSGQWLASRAEWLAARLEGNLADRTFGLSGTTDSVLFRDVDSGQRYLKLDGAQANLALPISALADRSRIQQLLDDATYARTVVFGSDSPGGGDQLLGLAGDDRLFGAAGDDSLDGADGDDYLEGGAGADTLIGGAGDDTLAGGEGVDRLEGGAGSDTYLYAAALDADTIVDRDGRIFAGEVLLTGGSGAEGGPFRSGDGRFSYAFSGDLESAGTLVVDGALRVEGFRNGDLGIRLVSAFEPREVGSPQTDATLLGDFEYVQDEEDGLDRDQYGNLHPARRGGEMPGRTESYSEFPGTPGNTHYVLGGGNDQAADIYGGDDWFELGAGNDTAFGGSGNDLLEGGPGSDVLSGGDGDDILLAGDIAGLATALDDAALPDAADSIEELSGEEGDDLLIGGLGRDFIGGGAGRDRILGGAGDDVIQAGAGDDTVFGGTGNDVIYAGTGADTLIGGDGNDTIIALEDLPGDYGIYVDGGAGDDDLLGTYGNGSVLIGGAGRDFLTVRGDEIVLLAGDGDDMLTLAGGGGYLEGGPGNDQIQINMESPDLSAVLRWGRGQGSDVSAAYDGTLIVALTAGVLPEDIAVATAQRTIRLPIRRPDGVPPPQAPPGAPPLDVPVEGYELSLGSGADSLFVLGPSPVAADLRIEFADGAVWGFDDLAARVGPPPPPDAAPALGGTASAELIFGTSGDDVFAGSAGDDRLTGGEGSDTYRYALGDGFDVIEDFDRTPGNTDSLVFAGGIAAADVDVFASGEDYIFAIGGGGIRLSEGRSADGAIERIEFADGTLWTPADVEARAAVLPDNRAPQMAGSLGRIAVDPGSRVSFSVPRASVEDPDRFDSLQYYAITADGERLPAWLEFDAATLTIAGTPTAQEAGVHELLLIAVDQSGAAALSTLTIAVGAEDVPASESSGADAGAQTEVFVAVDMPAAPTVPDPAPRPLALADNAAFSIPVSESDRVGVPRDPLFRDMQQRFDVLLQVGRANLSEGYAEAVREFEERRMQQEELPPPPPPADEEVAAWNSAMHAWHDRNPGFAETDLGGSDGTWTMGWGLPGPGDATYGGTAGAGSLPGLANPLVNARLTGVAGAPTLAEGLREFR
jgi:Ca2+-binding RTX toxin-like protein